MNDALLKPCTAFDGHRRISSGPLCDVAIAVKDAVESGSPGPILTFDDATGRVIDIDIRGSVDSVLERLLPASAVDQYIKEPRGRGRPKLGVIAREVTLLPRHWDWLSTQPGGASVSLRKLVEEARRTNGKRDRNRETSETAYRFMSAMAGDLPGFEEAARALFADDQTRFESIIATWPSDIQEHIIKLAVPKADHASAGDGKS
jgi:uncharacterized protein